jgi:TfoX/Sxy family transcriptional regulator of competence genes
MASDDVQALANRVEAAVERGLLSSKRMFGGITFLLDGNMLCCASPKGLMVRVGVTAEERALESPSASPCMGAGRRMPGFIRIEPGGIAKDSELVRWIELARAYVATLPPKKTTAHRLKPSSARSKANPNRKAKGTL